jgi:hypothetical protein
LIGELKGFSEVCFFFFPAYKEVMGFLLLLGLEVVSERGVFGVFGNSMVLEVVKEAEGGLLLVDQSVWVGMGSSREGQSTSCA